MAKDAIQIAQELSLKLITPEAQQALKQAAARTCAEIARVTMAARMDPKILQKRADYPRSSYVN